jgi:hypothetical protein
VNEPEKEITTVIETVNRTIAQTAVSVVNSCIRGNFLSARTNLNQSAYRECSDEHRDHFPFGIPSPCFDRSRGTPQPQTKQNKNKTKQKTLEIHEVLCLPR